MKNNISKIGIITAILFTIPTIGLIVAILKSIDKPIIDSFRENYILLTVILGICAFIFAIVSNLISFLITYFVDQKRIDEKQSEAFEIIKEIERHTKKESIVLKSEDRKSLSQSGFFDKIYNNASDIRISGIKLTPLINRMIF